MKKSIPNLLSIFRIMLVPLFMYIYLTATMQPWFLIAAIVLFISGLTDVLDGYIARKYNLITNVGKILDPFADKLTQVAVCICLTITTPRLVFLLIIFFLKEVCMLIGGVLIVRSGLKIQASKWFGKLATLVFYAITFFIIALKITNPTILTILAAIVATFLLFAFIMYIPVYFKVKAGIAEEINNKDAKLI